MSELSRTHEFNIKLREIIIRSGDTKLIRKMEKLVDEVNKKAGHKKAPPNGEAFSISKLSTK